MSLKRQNREIYYIGNIDLIDSNRNMAVIGSRHASEYGIKQSYSIGRSLAQMGINVVNGLAIGCDTYALKGALSAQGKCIAVMPCGLEQVVPKANRYLADEILEKGGLLVSEYPVGTEVEKYMYIERDRLQSEISEGIIVVEAGFKSGTMYTVRAAKRQGKPIACCRYAEIAREGVYYIIDGDKGLKEFAKQSLNRLKYKQVNITDLGLQKNLKNCYKSIYPK
jgi:DNA processing protein